MPIVRIPDPNALPTIPNDYVRQNNLIAIGFLQVNKSIWEDAANNIVQGAVFQVGGTIYYANAATAIGGVASAYIKLTPSGDGSTVAPTYIADLTGVTWNSTYNGYYDVSGNLYVFDELVAIVATEIAGANTRLWKAIVTMFTQDITFSGDLTLSGNTIFDNKITANGGIETDGTNLKTKKMDIGTWDMTAVPGSVNVAHGLTYAKIRGINVLIRNDPDSFRYSLFTQNGANSGYYNIDSTNIVLIRIAGQGFDNANFDIMGGDGNRGYVLITHEV